MRAHHKKGAACAALFLGLTGLTLFLLLRNEDFSRLEDLFRNVSLPCLAMGGGCMLFFFLCEAKNLQWGLSMFGTSLHYLPCLKFALVGFFFSSVTPSASGGQPMQLYAMSRCGCAASESILALLTEFFSFQLSAGVLACLGFLRHRRSLLSLDGPFLLCFLIGAVLSLLTITLLSLALLSPRLAPRLWTMLMSGANRFFPQRTTSWNRWGKEQWTRLRHCLSAYRSHKRVLFRMLLLSCCQIVVFHSIPYWAFASFGCVPLSLADAIFLQAPLFLSVSSLPLPGGAGASEGGFLRIYQLSYPASVLSGGLLLSRGLSFYLPLVFTGSFLVLRGLSTGIKTPH